MITFNVLVLTTLTQLQESCCSTRGNAVAPSEEDQKQENKLEWKGYANMWPHGWLLPKLYAVRQSTFLIVLRKLNECDDAFVLVRRDNHKCVRTCTIITYCTAKLCLARLFVDVFGFNRLHGRVLRVSSPISNLLAPSR